MDLLKDLYYQYFNNSEEYAELGDMAEVKDANADFYEYVKDFGQKHVLQFDDLLGNIASTYEMQGWVYGYMYAMKMLVACGIKVGEVA